MKKLIWIGLDNIVCSEIAEKGCFYFILFIFEQAKDPDIRTWQCLWPSIRIPIARKIRCDGFSTLSSLKNRTAVGVFSVISVKRGSQKHERASSWEMGWWHWGRMEKSEDMKVKKVFSAAVWIKTAAMLDGLRTTAELQNGTKLNVDCNLFWLLSTFLDLFNSYNREIMLNRLPEVRIVGWMSKSIDFIVRPDRYIGRLIFLSSQSQVSLSNMAFFVPNISKLCLKTRRVWYHKVRKAAASSITVCWQD